MDNDIDLIISQAKSLQDFQYTQQVVSKYDKIGKDGMFLEFQISKIKEAEEANQDITKLVKDAEASVFRIAKASDVLVTIMEDASESVKHYDGWDEFVAFVKSIALKFAALAAQADGAQ